MSRRVGICPVCKTKQRVAGAWQTPGGEPSGAYIVRRHLRTNDICRGTGMKPIPTKEQAKKDSWRFALVEPFRHHAAVALDAWVERKPYPDTDILCEVALREYTLRRPEASEVDILRYISHRTRINTRAGTGDCYCVFCGVLVFRNVSGMTYGMQRENLRRLRNSDQHPIECALKHLAFGLHPAAPTVRRLPDEYLNETAWASRRAGSTGPRRSCVNSLALSSGPDRTARPLTPRPSCGDGDEMSPRQRLIAIAKRTGRPFDDVLMDFEERSAVMEYDANLSRVAAELAALDDLERQSS